MYGIDGRRDLTESTRDDLTGYAGARPVRIGNGAFDQRQNDVYGAAWTRSCCTPRRSERLPRRLWPIVQAQAECASDVWREPDQGIWEARGKPQHYVSSKLMCWVALDRAAKLATIRGDRDARGWRATAEEIRPTSWSTACATGVLRQHYDTDSLDASTLLAAIFGFLPGDDKLLRRSVVAIAADLTEDGFVLRYRTEETDDGLSGKEGTFPICSFWLVSALAIVGELQDARDPMERLLRIASPLGLYAEEFDIARLTTSATSRRRSRTCPDRGGGADHHSRAAPGVLRREHCPGAVRGADRDVGRPDRGRGGGRQQPVNPQGGDRALLDGFALDEMPTGSRGKLLVPWLNRIQDGMPGVRREGHQLPIEEVAKGNAIHGLGRWVTWSVAEREPHRVVMRLLIDAAATTSLTVEVEVRAGRGAPVSTATNVGASACPARLRRASLPEARGPGAGRAEPALPGGTVPMADERGIPAGAEPVDVTEFDSPRPGPSGRRTDHAFGDLERDQDGPARGDPERGRARASLWADEGYGTSDACSPTTRASAATPQPRRRADDMPAERAPDRRGADPPRAGRLVQCSWGYAAPQRSAS